MDKTLETLDTLWDFTDERVYLLVAIARSKDNEDIQASDQPTMRKVVEDRDELEDKIEQLRHAARRFDHRYRLYGTVNGRDTIAAAGELQRRIIEWKYHAIKSGEIPNSIKRIDHKWKSILHQPERRDQKRFLYDLDEPTPAEVAAIRTEIQSRTDIIISKESPNGVHIVGAPFNHTQLKARPGTMELKTDGMLFLSMMEDLE